MSKRDRELRALAEVAKGLPDEEIARLEDFAKYLKQKRQEGEGRLDQAGAIIHWLASLRDSRDRSISFPPQSLLDLAEKWLEEGEGSEDRLRRAAHALVDYINPNRLARIDPMARDLFMKLEQALEEGEDRSS